MKLIHIYFGFFLVAFYCCTEKEGKNFKDIYTLASTNQIIEIKLDDNQVNLSPFIQVFNHNGGNFLAFLDFDLISINIYNIDSQIKVRSIDLKSEELKPFQSIVAFYIINPDTILLVNIRPPVIVFIDSEDKIVKKIPAGNEGEFTATIPWAGQKPLLSGNKLFLGQMFSFMETKGKLTGENIGSTKIAISIDLLSGLKTLYSLTYPPSLIGSDVSNMKVCRTLGYNNSFIYCFSLFDSLYITNEEHVSFKSKKIETNHKFSFSREHWKYINDIQKGMRDELLHDDIKNIFYDKYRECYYLLIREGQTDIDQYAPDFATRLQYGKCFIIILDKNLKHLGEVYFPDNVYAFQMMFITPEGLYISSNHVRNPEYDEKYLRFECFTLRKINE